jgi:hypothetical protein
VWDRKVTPLVQRYAAERGWHIISVCQPQHLFNKSIQRRHANVADPRDPWQVTLADDPSVLAASNIRYSVGATADDAVIAGVPRDLMSAIRRCEKAIDNLRDCLQK